MPITLGTMYAPQKDSPSVFLMGAITEIETTVVVSNAGVLPAPPFPLTLGYDKPITETVLVTAVNVGTHQITMVRTNGMLWDVATKAARVFMAADLSSVQSNIVLVGDHANNVSNPHVVTAAQVGSPTTAVYDAHVANVSNPHAVTAAQVGSPTTAAYAAHVANVSNPHAVTAAQVGSPTTAAYDAHVANVSNPHAVTAAQVGSPTTAAYNAHVANVSNPHTVTAAQLSVPTLTTFNAHANSVSNPHTVTAAQVGAIAAPASPTQGTILYFDGTNWVKLAPGTNGYFLKTLGVSANPIWANAGNASGYTMVSYSMLDLVSAWSTTSISYSTILSTTSPTLITNDVLEVIIRSTPMALTTTLKEPYGVFQLGIGATLVDLGQIEARSTGSGLNYVGGFVGGSIFDVGQTGALTVTFKGKSGIAGDTTRISVNEREIASIMMKLWRPNV